MIVNALLFVYRVLCGNKRPEPPNDSTPTAIVKKRRGLISDGNLKPVHKERADTSVSSVNRLQRCRSMVEQSVSFHRSKGRREFFVVGCCGFLRVLRFFIFSSFNDFFQSLIQLHSLCNLS